MKTSSVIMTAHQYAGQRGIEIVQNMGKNNLWKRMLKNVIATTVLVSIALIPGSENTIGKASYLGAMTTVFGHPGRRFGQMAEALILLLGGTLLGVAWSIFGVYLSSLVIHSNPAAAYTIKALFLALATIFHGFLRSQAPRLFQFVLLLIFVTVITLTSTSIVVTRVMITQILYPIFIAAGVILSVNLICFPEFSSSFLGETTIETLNETIKALGKAGQYFTENANVQDVSKLAEYRDTKEDESAQGPRKFSSVMKTLDEDKRVTKVLSSLGKPLNSLSNSKSPNGISLSELTAAKGKLRTKSASCKAAQRECNFEIAFSVLPPQNLKSISNKAMKRLVANTVAIIGACESKYALLGDSGSVHLNNSEEHSAHNYNDQNHESDAELSPSKSNFPITSFSNSSNAEKKRVHRAALKSKDIEELDMIKPRREIEFGDLELLQALLKQVGKPHRELHDNIARTVDVISACVAYTYSVPKLPSGARVPKGITVEEIDLHIENLQQALLKFDSDATSALEDAADLQGTEDQRLDIMPRGEVFLISSFLLNLRQAASHVQTMLKHSKDLVLEHQQRNGRRRIYAPRIHWAKWLYTGDEEVEALPAEGRKANRQGTSEKRADDDADTDDSKSKESLHGLDERGDIEKIASLGVINTGNSIAPAISQKSTLKNRKKPVKSLWLQLRGRLADMLEWFQDSDDILYAIKLTFAMNLVLWPAFITSWNKWYSLNRGLWAALQLVVVTEVSIGTSVMTIFLRAIGTTLGCLWGLAAWESYGGNRIVCAAMICIGLVPAVYVQLGTKYQKAGQVSIISMVIVALSTEVENVPGTAAENFLRRWIAFMIGGMVALLVELVLFPVKARTRLVESLTAVLSQIHEMEHCVDSGIDGGSDFDIFNPQVLLRFNHAKEKANSALSAAETFLPFCSTEPRIKGSFKGLALIYGEILFVLHQIVDRTDNMYQIRIAYGSGPLEEFNAQIYAYRRNVASSITLTLFAIHGALTTKLPLPQFLPSARLAYLRLINRVREVVHAAAAYGHDLEQTTKLARERAVRQKYISWNASAAARAEVIEYLEELIDLTKLLVGASEFRTGLLTRPSYLEYVKSIDKSSGETEHTMDTTVTDEVKETLAGDSPAAPRRRRRVTPRSDETAEDVPASLRRIHSRKTDAVRSGVRN